jgi:hypothetical protein
MQIVDEGFHLFTQLRIEVTQQDPQHDRGQHLGIKVLVKRLVWCGSRYCCARLHGLLPFGSGVGGGFGSVLVKQHVDVKPVSQAIPPSTTKMKIRQVS